MGCAASMASQSEKVTISKDYSLTSDECVLRVNEIWVKVNDSLDVPIGESNSEQFFGMNSQDWKTIRLFVSSTFTDFHPEREFLVKQVFPELRAWCEQRRLHLVECDLRWGVPKSADDERKMRVCLGEIDHCYEVNKMPFFLNLTSARVGWVPGVKKVPEAVRAQYKWIDGLSITEMEIMHGAYRNDNPNALFMLRDPSFLDNVPEEKRERLIDKAKLDNVSEEEERKDLIVNEQLAPYKLDILKKMVRDRFPDERVKYYEVEYAGYNEASQRVELTGFQKTFYEEVKTFFQRRIEKQYPLVEENLDPYQQAKQQHESFMKRCGTLIGRQDELNEIEKYITEAASDVPFMIVADAGLGKSSIMAKVADVATTRALEGSIPGAGNKDWHVFYHFVGAVPGSTELHGMLKRFLKELQVVDESSMPSDLDHACQLTCSTLANPNTSPVIMIIDALNQFDEDKAAELVSWVPRKLAPHVRCVFSMIPGTAQHKSLKEREPRPCVLQIQPLTKETKEKIVNELFGRYTKELDEEQMKDLLSKKSSENPLWLSIACEELRVFGSFSKVSDKIYELADGLLQLEMQVLDRLEKENGGELLKATLCLLEVSARGLLEAELLIILGHENCMPGEAEAAGGEKDDSKKEKEKGGKEKLPAALWAEVYFALRPFLRPFGDSGEGRLDFYHKSLSEAVRKKYFGHTNEANNPSTYQRWHRKLADFFHDFSRVTFVRKVEELPVHLIAIKDKARLEAFLTDWGVMEELFDMDYSYKLLTYWRLGSSFERLEECYTTLVLNYINEEGVGDPDKAAERCEIVARILTQAGCHQKASELCSKALDIEKNKLGARLHRMAMLYHLQGLAGDEEMKLEQYLKKDHLPRMKIIIESYRDAARILETIQKDDKKHKTTLGKIYNRLAFYYIGYNYRKGDNYLSASEAYQLAHEYADKAIAVFKELGDEHNVADSTVTKGLCYERAAPEKIKCYKEAEKLAIQASGKLNTVVDRLYLNMGIYYKEVDDKREAYKHFYKWFETCRDFYGFGHPKVNRSIKMLHEEEFTGFAQEEGNVVPELSDSVGSG